MEWIIFIIVPLGIAWLIYASYSINSQVYVKTLCKSSTQERVVTLTFDDGIDAQQTPLVLDVLKKHDAKAIFFLIGERTEKYPEIAGRILKEGHLIGNHSYTHRWSFPLSSYNVITEELCRTEALLTSLAGKEQKLFRPPFGVTNPIIGRAVLQLGYHTIGWSIRSLDTSLSREQTLRRIEKRLHPGAIILLHDNLPESHILLEELLELLYKQNYRVQTIDT